MSTIKKADPSDVFKENALVINSVLHLTQEVTKKLLHDSDALPDRSNVTPTLIQTLTVKAVKQQLLLED